MATTRQRLDRHFWAGWILVGAVCAILAGLHGIFNSAAWWFVTLGVLLLGILAVFAWMYFTACVICGQPLRRMGLLWRPGAHANWSPPCPNCKKHIDRVEPLRPLKP